jgi:hypothetical protein
MVGDYDDKWQVLNGLMVVGPHIYITLSSQCLSTVLDSVHGMGHEAIEKTLHRLC